MYIYFWKQKHWLTMLPTHTSWSAALQRRFMYAQRQWFCFQNVIKRFLDTLIPGKNKRNRQNRGDLTDASSDTKYENTGQQYFVCVSYTSYICFLNFKPEVWSVLSPLEFACMLWPVTFNKLKYRSGQIDYYGFYYSPRHLLVWSILYINLL